MQVGTGHRNLSPPRAPSPTHQNPTSFSQVRANVRLRLPEAIAHAPGSRALPSISAWSLLPARARHSSLGPEIPAGTAHSPAAVSDWGACLPVSWSPRWLPGGVCGKACPSWDQWCVPEPLCRLFPGLQGEGALGPYPDGHDGLRPQGPAGGGDQQGSGDAVPTAEARFLAPAPGRRPWTASQDTGCHGDGRGLHWRSLGHTASVQAGIRGDPGLARKLLCPQGRCGLHSGRGREH